jgi:type IV secretory pathway VirB9-like protein
MSPARFLGCAAFALGSGFVLGYAGAQALAEHRMDRSMQILFALALAGIAYIEIRQSHILHDISIGCQRQKKRTPRRQTQAIAIVTAALFSGMPALPANAGGRSVPYPPATKMINEGSRDLFVVECAPLSVCTVFLPANETPNAVHPVIAGDTTRWKYEVNTAGGRWFVAVKPVSDKLTETMQINTDRAAHVVRVISKPFVRTVTYAFFDSVTTVASTRASAAPAPPKPLLDATYNINGSASFRPGIVQTDGNNTFIGLPPKSLQPTVYGIDRSGQQYPIHVVPPRYIGDNVLVLDGTPDHFIMESGPGKKDERIDVRRTK